MPLWKMAIDDLGRVDLQFTLETREQIEFLRDCDSVQVIAKFNDGRIVPIYLNDKKPGLPALPAEG